VGKLDTLTNKLTSGRYLMTAAFTITCCVGFIKGMVQSEAFVGIVVLIANEYFKRSDRPSDKELLGGGQANGTNGTTK